MRVLPAAASRQLCLGRTYRYSVFVINWAQLEGSRQTPRLVIVAVCLYYGASMNLPRALSLFEPKNWRWVGGGHDFLQLTRHNYVIIHLAVHEWADA